MSLIDFLIHFFSFLLPSAFLALTLPFLFKWFKPPKTTLRPYFVTVFRHFLISAGIASAGLLALGADGKMYTYMAICLALAWFSLR